MWGRLATCGRLPIGHRDSSSSTPSPLSCLGGVCAPQSGDCHQFPPLELDGCTRFAPRKTLPPRFPALVGCARRKTGTATNSRLWNWMAVPGLPHGNHPLPAFLPWWGVRAAKRGLPPIPAFGIRWLSPVCPTENAPSPLSCLGGVCAPQSGDCHQFPPLELDGCTRFAPRKTLPSRFPALVGCARRKTGTATNSLLWDWMPVPGLPHGNHPLPAFLPWWGVRAAKRGLPPIPAFGIGWLYPVCPTGPPPSPLSCLGGVCAPQNGDCHQFPPLELDGCTRFAPREPPPHFTSSGIPAPRLRRACRSEEHTSE